jgi:D-tagatose-1,6-bisphosphate aldolase subunit GatZ/KbaZ
MSGVLKNLAAADRKGRSIGITSICSAHPLVIRASARHGARHSEAVLIEATCNQVNQFGGYTGMQPADFVALVHRIASEEGLDPRHIVLGGDHLGPNPWRNETASSAMAKAEEMITAYVQAGFRKLHLDTSMGCSGEPEALDDATTAERAVRLAKAAELAALSAGGDAPVYIIGTEVPPPGGAHHVITELEPTSVDAARRTVAIHRDVFARQGMTDVFSRVIALVVQPGVEFGNENVVVYDPTKAEQLSRLLGEEEGLVYEAHSTDYQGRVALRRLVEDGFAILKVGPELTFVLREALYGLDLIASDLVPGYPPRQLFATMEKLMLAKPGFWQGHYHGSNQDQRIQRHYSYSDRIRYYWNQPEALAAVNHLMTVLQRQPIPATLLRQHLPSFAAWANGPPDPEALLVAAVERTLEYYRFACTGKV